MHTSCDFAFRSFWTCVWFIFITMSTVGYGDHSPHTVMGQIATLGIVAVMFLSLPGWINDISE